MEDPGMNAQHDPIEHQEFPTKSSREFRKKPKSIIVLLDQNQNIEIEIIQFINWANFDFRGE